MCSYYEKPLLYMKVIEGLKELEILIQNFLVCLVETFAACTHHSEEKCTSYFFSKIMNQISVLEMSFSIFKWTYLIAFMHVILYPSKECLVLDRNVHKTFSSLNTTFPVSSLNEILFLHKTFSFAQQAFIIDIIFQMHPYLTTLWWVIVTGKIKS